MKPEGGQFDLSSVVSAAQAGSVPAARQIVERYQHDLMGIAYLLTGDQSRATDLAGYVFEQALDQLQGFDVEDDLYPWLLRHIPLALLNFEARQPQPIPEAPPVTVPGSSRFVVDDDRSRLRNALQLLDIRERLQLILSDYAGLDGTDASSIAALLGARDDDAPSEGDTRRRLRGLAAIDERQSISNALRRLAVESPRTPLWGDIEHQVEARFARQRFRNRLTSVGAVGAVLALLGGVGLFLLYGAMGSGDSTSSGTGANPSLTATSPSATATFPPTPTPMIYAPAGDVPDLLLTELTSANSNLGLSNPAGDVGALPLPPGDLEGISPDGRTLLLIYQEWHPDRVEMTLIAASSTTGEELWRADVRPLAEGGPDSTYFDLVVIDDLVYVASHDSNYLSNVLTVAVIHLDDGALRDIWGLRMGVEFSGPGLEIELYGTVQPQSPALTIHIRSYEHGWQKIQQIDLRTGATIFDSDPVVGFDDSPGTRMLAPDGRGIIVIPPDGLSAAPTINYLIFDTMTQGEVELPFIPIDELGGVVVEYLLSHDGRWLYALDIYNQQVAIVDLERRQVERVIDLQGGEAARDRSPNLSPWMNAVERIGSSAALSPDGQYIYALSPTIELPGDPFPASSAIWKIDTSSWMIEAEWMLYGPSPHNSISSNRDGQKIYVSRNPASTESAETAYEMLVVSTVYGEIENMPVSLDQPVIGTIADFYRQHYGRSPSVDGVVPVDNRELSTTPTVDVQVSPSSAPTGTSVNVRVRLLDPVTGEMLTGNVRSNLRNPAPATIIATFQNGDERRAAILVRSPEGEYEGQFALGLPGAWTLTLSAGDPELDGWSVTRPAVVRLIDAVTGPDGRDYVLETWGFPNVPAAGEEFELTVRFVPALGIAVTGVDDEISAYLPASIDLTLQDGSMFTLHHTAFLNYSGPVTFPSPGVTFPTVTFTGFGEQPTAIVLRIEVVDAR